MKRIILALIVLTLNATALPAQFAWQPIQEETPVVARGDGIKKVVAHTKVGDWGTVVGSLEVTVSSRKLLRKLTAADFDIVNNVANTMYDPRTGEMVADWEDDGISLSTKGNVLTIKVKEFDAEGKRNRMWRKEPWQVICKNPALSFSARDVDEKTIEVIDDCIRGSYTYAGITREYLLHLPKDRSGKVIPNAPLFVWQIGGGEYDKGLMTAALANKCLTSLPEHGYGCATLVFAIANPNYSYSASLDPERIKLIDRNNALQMAFIDELIREGKVDGSRLFCAGASSGGGCTMRFMMQFPGRFKAAVPCCAMDPIVPIHQVKDLDEARLKDELTEAFKGKVYKWDGSDMVPQDIDTEAFVKLPMYFVHAADDQTCKLISSLAYKEARQRLGARDDMLRVYSDADMKEYGFGGFLAHFSWCRLLNDYSEGSAMDWLVKKF